MLSYNTSTNYCLSTIHYIYSTQINHALCWVTDAAGKAISYYMYMTIVTLELVFHHGHLFCSTP